MDDADPAVRRARNRGVGSEATQDRLMTAAAELIAELGWGRVTTRAVAGRAGVPHGSVSYHFSGKQDLLVRAALRAFEEALPTEAMQSLQTVDDVLALIRAQIGDHDAIDATLSALMLESMREAERDPVLRERLAEMLSTFRGNVVRVVRADQQRGTVPGDVSPDAVAAILGALGDGLLLHALLDPDLDPTQALDGLGTLLHTRTDPGR
jgi:AcrR family transcriptional regulator